MATSLLNVAAGGDRETVRQILASGVDIDDDNDGNWTALIMACYCSNLEVIRLLLKEGANINQTSDGNSTALIVAASTNKVDAVKILLEHPNIAINQADRNGETALLQAAHMGHLQTVTLLMEKGADPFITSNNNRNAVEEAVRFGSTDAACLILDMHFDLSFQKWTPLLLLASGAGKGVGDKKTSFSSITLNPPPSETATLSTGGGGSPQILPKAVHQLFLSDIFTCPAYLPVVFECLRNVLPNLDNNRRGGE